MGLEFYWGCLREVWADVVLVRVGAAHHEVAAKLHEQLDWTDSEYEAAHHAVEEERVDFAYYHLDQRLGFWLCLLLLGTVAILGMHLGSGSSPSRASHIRVKCGMATWTH